MIEINGRHLTIAGIGALLTVLTGGAALLDQVNGYTTRQHRDIVEHTQRDDQLNSRITNLELAVRALARKDEVDQQMIEELINSVPRAEVRMRADAAMQRAMDQQIMADAPAAAPAYQEPPQ